MRLLVLGGSGNLGATLCSLAVQAGHEALATCNQRRPGVPGVKWFAWDALQRPLPTDLAKENVDVIMHCMALINPDVCEQAPATARRINAQSVLDAVDVVAGCMLVYISSDYVFDGTLGSYKESDAACPVNEYGRTKLDGERYAQRAMRSLVVRGAFFGKGWSGLGPTRLEEQLKALDNGTEVRVAADQIGTPLWTGTFARLLLILIEQGVDGIQHVAGPTPISKATLLSKAASASGISDSTLRSVATPALSFLAPRPLNVSLVCSPDVAKLPQYPRSIDDEMRSYLSS